jgi:hypothetical protein
MTIDQLSDLLKYIMKNNGWEDLYTNSIDKCRICFKYVDISFDTRDGFIWQICFREGVSINKNVEDKVFHIESKEDIKAIYEFLNG